MPWEEEGACMGIGGFRAISDSFWRRSLELRGEARERWRDIDWLRERGFCARGYEEGEHERSSPGMRIPLPGVEDA
jgi:hypothetical protein